MALLQGLLFLVFGVGLLSIDYQSLQRGRLPAGSDLLRGRKDPEKDAQGFGFWLMFVVYGAGGLWLVIFAVQVLFGLAEPLPVQ